ncbi:MAG: hypothetical protein KDD62_04235, partial [Bdellovibrionales bacterium]|nr:hypothetical protein [Bdellovibrionales bacterium]
RFVFICFLSSIRLFKCYKAKLIKFLFGVFNVLIHPSIILLLGVVMVLSSRRAKQQLAKILIPGVVTYLAFVMPPESGLSVQFMNMQLGLMKVDLVSTLFTKLFALVGLVAAIFLFRKGSTADYCGSFIYLAATFGTILAGDWVTFLVFWELLTVGAFILIYNGGQTNSHAAAKRYLYFHVFGGLFMMLGVAMLVLQSGNQAIGPLDLTQLPSMLIFAGMGMNAGFPLFHFWIVDSYPESSPGGTVLLAALTTKTAIYGLIRAFPGTELLIIIGTVMAVFPLVFAFVERDYRRVLSYCLLSPIGFMLIGIGLGTEAALQGTLAFVVSHVLYKSLYFIAAGSLMHGGVTMRMDNPSHVSVSAVNRLLFILAAFIMVMPGTTGYVSKTLLLSEVKHLGFSYLYYVLVVASLLVLFIAGLRPFSVFFRGGIESGASIFPSTVLAAMILVVVSLALGICPEWIFYGLLPGNISVEPNELGHILQQCLYVGITFGVYLALRRVQITIDTQEYDVRKLWTDLAALLYKVLSSLNKINELSHVTFVKGLPSALYEGIPNASDALLKAVYIPYWSVQGNAPQRRRNKVALLKAENRNGFFPIGYTIIATTILFLLLFAFFLLR